MSASRNSYMPTVMATAMMAKGKTRPHTVPRVDRRMWNDFLESYSIVMSLGVFNWFTCVLAGI